jgi:hypothetical protein
MEIAGVTCSNIESSALVVSGCHFANPTLPRDVISFALPRSFIDFAVENDESPTLSAAGGK